MSSVRYCTCAQFENSDMSDVSVVRQEVSPFNEHSESYNKYQEHDQYLLTEGCEVFRLVLRVQYLAWRWSPMCVQT